MSDYAVMPMTDYQDICDAVREKTGKSDLITSGIMADEISGIEAGGEYPKKFYETNFEIDDSFTENGPICAISTGLSTDMVAAGNQLVCVVITCEQPTITPAANFARKVIQFISPNQGVVQSPAIGWYVQENPEGGQLRKFSTSAVGAYVYTATADLSTLNIYGRFNVCPPIQGDYRLELFETGFVV